MVQISQWASNADGTWRNRTGSGDYIPDMTSTWSKYTNATFDLTGVQLETGSVATPSNIEDTEMILLGVKDTFKCE